MQQGPTAGTDVGPSDRTTVLFGALILTAIVGIDPWGWDEAGPLRWALTSTIAAALIAVALAGTGRSRLHRVERSALIAITVGGVVGVAVSPDTLHAVIGTPDRHFGALTWLLCVGVFVATRRGGIDATWIARAAAIGSAALGAWTVAELAGVDWFERSAIDGRAGGPFAQPAFLGAAAVLFGPVSTILLRSTGARRDRVLGIGGISGAAIALLGSGSRAALLGALLAGAAVLATARDRRPTVDRRVAASTVAGLVAIGLITPGVGRLTDALTGTDAIERRLDEWRVGLRAWTDDPLRFITGWGPEGYRAVFGRFVDEDYVIDYGRVVFTDRAHSAPIDIGLSIGVIGVVGWAALFGSVIVAARRRHDDPVVLALFASIVGYLAQQLALFPIAELDLVAFGLLGVLAAHVHGAEHRARPSPVLAGGAALATAVMFFAGVADVAADRAVAADPPDADRAVDLRPDSIRYAFIAARAEPRTTAASLLRALDHIERGLDRSPVDPALRLEEATIRVELARVDPSAADTAARIVEGHLVDDPLHPQLLMQHGIALALLGDLDAAVDRLRTAARLAPESIEVRLNLSLVLIETNDPDAAAAVLDQAEALAPADPRVERLREEISSP